MNKVWSSLLFRGFLGIGSLAFSGTQHGLRGSFAVVYDSQIFWKSCLAPKMRKIGQAQGSLNVWESLVFFSVLYFFINLVYNESLYYCNCCMLEQISYLGKFWFLRYGPKCSWASRLWDFSINRKTLKLAVSREEINYITRFCCIHPTVFSKMAH